MARLFLDAAEVLVLGVVVVGALSIIVACCINLGDWLYHRITRP